MASRVLFNNTNNCNLYNLYMYFITKIPYPTNLTQADKQAEKQRQNKQRATQPERLKVE